MSSRRDQGNTTVVLLANFRFHRLRLWLSPSGEGSRLALARWLEGSPTEWSGQGDSYTLEAGLGGYRRKRADRHGSARCGIRRQWCHGIRKLSDSCRAAGHPADRDDDDTSRCTCDKPGDPGRYRKHASGFRAGFIADAPTCNTTGRHLVSRAAGSRCVRKMICAANARADRLTAQRGLHQRGLPVHLQIPCAASLCITPRRSGRRWPTIVRWDERGDRGRDGCGIDS